MLAMSSMMPWWLLTMVWIAVWRWWRPAERSRLVLVVTSVSSLFGGLECPELVAAVPHEVLSHAEDAGVGDGL